MVETFEVELKDKITPNAKNASRQVGILVAQMNALERAGVKAAASGDINKYRALGKQFSALGSEVSRLKTEFPESFAPHVPEAASNVEVLTGAMGELAGPAALVGSAMLALAAATGAAVLKGAELAIVAGEEKEHLSALFEAMGHGKVAGAEVIGMLDKMSGSLGMTREEMAPFAKQLLAFGFTDLSQLKSQMTAIASINVTGGPEAVEKYISVLGKLREGAKVSSKDLLALQKAGVDVDRIAKELGMKSFKELSKALDSGRVSASAFQTALKDAATESGAKALEAKAKSLSAQWALFKENVSHLFEDVDASAFLDALRPVLALFSQSTVEGRAMKTEITKVFTAIFDAAASALPYVKTVIDKVIIALLQMDLATRPLRAQLGQLWDQMNVGDSAVGAFASQLTEVVRIVAAVSGIATKVIGAIQDISAVFQAGGTSIGQVFTAGVLDGLTGGMASVVSKGLDLARSLVSAVKGALDAHSPSRVMASVGMDVGTGLAQGMQKSAPAVHSVAGDMGAGIPKAANDNVAAPAASSPSAGASRSIGPITVNVQIDGAGKDAEEITADMVAKVFEQLAIMQGLGLTGS